MTLGLAPASPSAAPGAERDRKPAATVDRGNRTFICTVLFLDIVGYSKKPVAEQLQVKEFFNDRIAAAIRDVAAADRIVLDTGDGVAVNFLGDPEDALFVALNLREALSSGDAPPLEVRVGINLGPVRLVQDINDQPNIIGDGINVAQRVMSFAHPGQILVSRSYHDVVARISAAYAEVFAYQGSYTDKHVREHEVYEVSAAPEVVMQLAQRRARQRQARAADAAVDSNPAIAVPVADRLLRSRRMAYSVVTLSVGLLLGAYVYTKRANPDPPDTVARPAVAPIVIPRSDPGPKIDTGAAPVAQAAADATTPPAVEAAQQTGPAPRIAHETRRASKTKGKSSSATSAAAPAAMPVAPVVPPQAAASDKRTVDGSSTTLPTGIQVSAGAPWAAPQPAPSTATVHRAASAKAALITLAVSPWGEVVVDGKAVGISPPLVELELAPGKHVVEIRNGQLAPYKEVLELGTNQTVRIKHKFSLP